MHITEIQQTAHSKGSIILEEVVPSNHNLSDADLALKLRQQATDFILEKFPADYFKDIEAQGFPTPETDTEGNGWLKTIVAVCVTEQIEGALQDVAEQLGIKVKKIGVV